MPKYYTNIDLTKNELQNARIQNLASAPANPVMGQIYFNTADKKLYVNNGASWDSFASSAGAMASHGDEYHNVAYEKMSNKENASLATTAGDATKYPTVGLVRVSLEALNTSIGTLLADKVDKIAGKGLSTNDYSDAEKTKLAGIAAGANNYVHPANHSPSIITQDSTNRFVTDAEKSLWNAKSDLGLGVTSTTAFRGDYGNTAYTHAQTVTGNPHGTTKTDLGLSNVENKSSSTIRSEITSANVTTALTFTPENVAKKGVINGYPSLDATGKIPLSQLPDISKQQTYVVTDSDARALITGMIAGDKVFETGTGDSYIYNGSAWLLLSSSDWENINLDWGNIVNAPALLALGTLSTTAYRGDHGLIAYNHSQVAHAPSDAQKNSNITKAEIEAKLTGEITTHTHPSTTRKAAATIGNGTLTSFNLDHNFDTKDVIVSISETASPYEMIFADVSYPTTNRVTVNFSVAPTLNQFRIVVIG